MPRAMRVCPCTGCPAHPSGCPELTAGGRCPDCKREADHRRGSAAQRGYGKAHQRERERWRPKVERLSVHCHAKVCLEPARLILTGQDWDLGHTEDRTAWTGPEHATCNRSAGAKVGNRRRAT